MRPQNLGGLTPTSPEVMERWDAARGKLLRKEALRLFDFYHKVWRVAGEH
jgi:hypothetical protein